MEIRFSARGHFPRGISAMTRKKFANGRSVSGSRLAEPREKEGITLVPGLIENPRRGKIFGKHE